MKLTKDYPETIEGLQRYIKDKYGSYWKFSVESNIPEYCVRNAFKGKSKIRLKEILDFLGIDKIDG